MSELSKMCFGEFNNFAQPPTNVFEAVIGRPIYRQTILNCDMSLLDNKIYTVIENK